MGLWFRLDDFPLPVGIIFRGYVSFRGCNFQSHCVLWDQFSGVTSMHRDDPRFSVDDHLLGRSGNNWATHQVKQETPGQNPATWTPTLRCSSQDWVEHKFHLKRVNISHGLTLPGPGPPFGKFGRWFSYWIVVRHVSSRECKTIT